MKVDKEYIKGLLEAFEAAEGPYTDIEELRLRGFSYETNSFIFHMQLLFDKNLIESDSKKGGIGIVSLGRGDVHWSIVGLRLTSDGHDFLSALRQPQVWDKIVSGFKDASLGVIKNVAIDLATGYAKKKINNMIEN